MNEIISSIINGTLSQQEREYYSNLIQVVSGLSAIARQELISEGHLECEHTQPSLQELINVCEIIGRGYFSIKQDNNHAQATTGLISNSELLLAMQWEQISIRDVISFAELLLHKVLERWIDRYGTQMELLGGEIENLEQILAFRAVRLNSEHYDELIAIQDSSANKRYSNLYSTQSNQIFNTSASIITTTRVEELRSIQRQRDHKISTFYSELCFPAWGPVMSIAHIERQTFLIQLEFSKIIDYLLFPKVSAPELCGEKERIRA